MENNNLEKQVEHKIAEMKIESTSFLKSNKWRIFAIIFLIFVFMLVAVYVNGRSIYQERIKEMQTSGR